MSKKLTKEEIIERARKVHGERYNYSLFLDSSVTYKGLKQYINIICPIHNVFTQSILHHLQGEGCKECAKIQRSKNRIKPFEEFVAEAVKIHGSKYIYLEENYKSCSEDMEIICTVCGKTFKQKPSKHLIGQGCPNCYRNSPPNNKMSVYEFEEKATEVHNGKYKYIHDFTTTKDDVTVICPIHGEFRQEAQSHLQGHGCYKCAFSDSKAENEIYEFVCTLVGDNDVIRQDRKFLERKELDILIPKLRIAIEYNGIRWHSEEFNKDRNYHLKKLIECNEKGIRLIQIFEDEWIEHKELVLSKLKHILGFNNNEKIYARKCEIKEIDKHIGYDFLNKNHIQGSVGSTVLLGAFYNNELIAVMSFTNDGEDCWNLTRFATDNSKRCIGVAGKLFKAFLTAYNPKYIKSFADRRWTLSEKNNLYTNLGFKLASVLTPDYRYVNGKKRDHKFNYRKQILNRKYGLPLSMTETEMTTQLGFYRIWDCGLYKFEWNKEEEDC